MERATVQQHLAGRKRAIVSDGGTLHVRHAAGPHEVFHQKRRLRQSMETHTDTICHRRHPVASHPRIRTGVYQGTCFTRTFWCSHPFFDQFCFYGCSGIGIYTFMVQERRRMQMAKIHHPLRTDELDKLYLPIHHRRLHLLRLRVRAIHLYRSYGMHYHRPVHLHRSMDIQPLLAGKAQARTARILMEERHMDKVIKSIRRTIQPDSTPFHIILKKKNHLPAHAV